MIKYFVWIVKVGVAIIWEYFTWMRRYARHPERYPQAERFARGKKLARKMLRRMNVVVEIRNEPEFAPDKVYYFVGNHTSLMDALVTLAYLPLPVRYVSKKENRELPFVNTMFKIVGGVYIERDNLKQEIKAMQLMRESLANGESSWLLFPEGTRNRDYHRSLLEYKAGSFKAALQTNTTIIPFLMQGNQLILPRKTRAKKYHVVLDYLTPVVPSGTTNDLADHIYALSNARITALKEEYATMQPLNKFGREFIKPRTR